MPASPPTATGSSPAASGAPAPQLRLAAQLTRQVPAGFSMVGVTWSPGTAPGGLVVDLRTAEAGSWSSWSALPIDNDAGPAAAGLRLRVGTDPAWVGSADELEVAVYSVSGRVPSDLQVNAINPGTSSYDAVATGADQPATGVSAPPAATSPAPTQSSPTSPEPTPTTTSPASPSDPTTTSPASPGDPTSSPTTSEVTPTATTSSGPATAMTALASSTATAGSFPTMPHIITRAQWGADPSLTRSCAPDAIGTQFAVVFVHHTATSNKYSESQVPSIIRGIYAYHTQGEGWCDIGYNFLIDKYGNVYEGRRGGLRRPVRGAQVLNYNTNTTGVALIGNFETTHPTTAMKSSLVSLVAWRLGAAYHPATGWTTVNGLRLHRISGHRDAYPTECPGQVVYNWLPTLRTLVADRLGSYQSPIQKAWLAAGGDGSSLGPVDVLERGYHGGRTTHFDHGQGFSNTSTGYLLTDGSILSRYHSLGSAGSYLGFPRSDNTRVAGTKAYFVRFAGGRIYNSRTTGAHDLANGPILTYYLDHGGPAGALGLPLSSVRKTSTGLAATFQGGTVTYNSSTGVTSTFDPDSFQTYYVPVTKTWIVDGHGYGHGHGMSQYGAQGAAEQGLTYQQILSFYYPNTTQSPSGGYIRVWITENTADNVVVLPAKKLQVTDLTDGATWTLPTSTSINRWRLLRVRNHLARTAVQYHTPSGWHAWTSPTGRSSFTVGGQFRAAGPVTMVLGGKQLPYSGALRLVPTYPGSHDRFTVNSLGLDNYVRGVVAREMPSYWDAAALQSQAVAARTYAAWERSQSPNDPYQICDTSACQVYGGVSAQTTATNAAVAATAHQILTYNGKPAFTQFASSSGGWTAYGGEPYLPAKRDPYDGWSGNPVHDWTVKLDTDMLQAAYYASVGHLRDIRVTQRDGNGQWGGRVETLVLEGTKGNVTISGDDFRAFYGLRSDWFAMEPTPIIKRWFTLGGTGSALGLPTSGQYRTGAGGAVQTFQHGSIYWSASTGAWDLSGPMLSAYKLWGGPASTVGFPESSEVALSDGSLTGQRVKFQVGYAYWSSTTGTGAHYVYGRIMSAWWKHGSWSGWIGFPTSNLTSPTTNVLQCSFQHAVITYDTSTKALTITKTS